MKQSRQSSYLLASSYWDRQKFRFVSAVWNVWRWQKDRKFAQVPLRCGRCRLSDHKRLLHKGPDLLRLNIRGSKTVRKARRLLIMLVCVLGVLHQHCMCISPTCAQYISSSTFQQREHGTVDWLQVTICILNINIFIEPNALNGVCASFSLCDNHSPHCTLLVDRLRH